MSPLEHVDDYPEIPVSLGSTRESLKTGGWRSVRPVLTDRTAPCAAGCPAGIAIPAYLHDITSGRVEEAYARFAERNPFPRITGRVCPHTCQDVCNLAVTTPDGAVSIRSIERWLGDATAAVPHRPRFAPTGRRMAIVGSGPAGLAAAYYLRRSGHEVTVFERRSIPGGMLRHAIPEYRLPASVVDEEIARLVGMGVVFRTGVNLGRDVRVDELEREFDAVFLATGACRERAMGVPGEALFTSGLAFLDAVRSGEAVVPGPQCAVIGGGNTAMDVARVLRRLGADVTVLYRRTVDEMPAIDEEYLRAVDDGVVFSWLTLPRAAVASADGRITVTVEEMRLGEPDASGRRSPEPTGITWERVFDGVFAAVGEVADLDPIPDRLIGSGGWIEVGDGGATRDDRLLAGGDVVSGPATVIAAIVAGREAARTIDRRFGIGDRWPDDPVTSVVTPDEVNTTHRIRHTAATDAMVPGADPMAEETATLSAATAGAEIERCLSCGHCNECGTCFTFCPDAAIRWEDGPVVDLDYCKGCGICVVECPGRAMVLVSEREGVLVDV